MGCIALVRCVLVLRCGLAGVVWYPDAGWSTSTPACIRIKMMHGPINIKFFNILTGSVPWQNERVQGQVNL